MSPAPGPSALSDSSSLLVCYCPDADGGEWISGVEEYLTPRGVRVAQATSDVDTRRCFERESFDAAILSERESSGWDLRYLRLVRSLQPRLPCLVVTADASTRTLSRALELEAFSLLTRPVDELLLRRQLIKLFLKRLRKEI